MPTAYQRDTDTSRAPQLLTVGQVADRLAVAPRTVRDWMTEHRRSGGLRGLRAVSLSARCVRVTEADLVAWIADRSRSATP